MGIHDDATSNMLGAALAQLTIIRSMLKTLKKGKPLSRAQAQQALFSALYAADDEAVKECLNDIHSKLAQNATAKGQADSPNKIGKFFQGLAGGPSESQKMKEQETANITT